MRRTAESYGPVVKVRAWRFRRARRRGKGEEKGTAFPFTEGGKEGRDEVK